MAGVGEEGDRGTCEEVPVKAGVLDFDIRVTSVGLDILWELTDEDNAGVNKCKDRHDTDMSKTAHISDQRQWEEHEQGCGGGLHGSVLPGVKEGKVVLGSHSTLLKESGKQSGNDDLVRDAGAPEIHQNINLEESLKFFPADEISQL